MTAHTFSTKPQKQDHKARPRFDLGNIYFTPGAMEIMDRLQTDPFELLYRHRHGDWGDCIGKEDALRYGTRILSAYELTASMNIEGTTEPVKVLITEADRSATTLLLPEEY